MLGKHFGVRILKSFSVRRSTFALNFLGKILMERDFLGLSFQNDSLTVKEEAVDDSKTSGLLLSTFFLVISPYFSRKFIFNFLNLQVVCVIEVLDS